MGYFYNKFENETLNKVHELLEDVTPLKYDCGMLCGGRCCKGSDNDGMLLFPGEATYYTERDGFTVKTDKATGMPCVICNGTCSREDRPLSCKIFPLFFYAGEKDGKTAVVPNEDIRARGVCPLVYDKYRYNPRFERKMRIAANYIRQNDEFCSFLLELTEKITDFGLFSAY